MVFNISFKVRVSQKETMLSANTRRLSYECAEPSVGDVQGLNRKNLGPQDYIFIFNRLRCCFDGSNEGNTRSVALFYK